MIRLVSNTILTIIIILLPLACQRDKEPPPRMLTGQGSILPPLYLSNDKPDSKILGPAAEAGAAPVIDRSVETPAESASEKITIDDSSAEAIMQTCVKIAAAQQFALWPDVVVPEQREMAEAIVNLIGVIRQFTQVMEAKFPGHAIQLPVASNLEMPRITIVGIKVISDQKAVATIRGEKATKDVEISVRLVGDGWRIEEPNIKMMSSMGVTTSKLAGQVDVLKELITRVEDDEFSDAQDVMNEATQLMAKAAGAPTGKGGQAGPAQASPKKTDKTKASKPKKERPKSEIERQMDVTPGPGILPRG